MKRFSLAILTLSLLATPSGGGPISVHPSRRGVKIQTREITNPTNRGSKAVSIWNVASHKRLVVMKWTCTPFQTVDASRGTHDCDASMWLSPAVPGHKQIKVLRRFDKTNLDGGRKEAHVLAKSGHPGVTRMRLIVGLDDQNCPAGEYCTTVNLSVSAL